MVIIWVVKHGVKVTLLLEWHALHAACKCFAPASFEVFEGKAYRRLLIRGVELGVARSALERFRSIAGVTVPGTGG